MPLTMTAEREAEIRKFSAFTKGLSPTGDLLSEVLEAWDAERTAHQETLEELDGSQYFCGVLGKLCGVERGNEHVIYDAVSRTVKQLQETQAKLEQQQVHLLCSNCNQGKRRNKGICPHKNNI